jgi:uncharacterized protein (DUF488 family)
MTVFTIGYEGLSVDAFVSLLETHGVETVVDIRELPLSRKPGFSKKSLSNHLNLAGFEYVHMAALGCPKPVRDRYREDGDWRHYTKGFTSYLRTQADSIEKLSEMVQASSCALLCYEADFNFCHRSIVANAVRGHSDARITHISGRARTATLASRRPALA